MSAPGRDAKGGVSITTLMHVPIDNRFFFLVNNILRAHGASLAETQDEPLPPGATRGTTKMYTVTFPPGTLRENGLVMRRSVPFEIRFPDAFRLHGAELWPLHLHDQDTCINVFSFPRDVMRKR